MSRTRVPSFESLQPTLYDIFLRIAGPDAGRRAMRKILKLAKREYLESVKTKDSSSCSS